MEQINFKWINTTGDTYRPVKDPIPNAVEEFILPVFEKLGNQTFLECCKNNMSSKPNEAYHHVLWGPAPKDSYCSTQELQLAVKIRVCIFNSGILWTHKLFDECGLVMSIGLLCKLQNLLPRAPLIIIYEAYIRPHLDYGDILYDQAYMSFHQKLESIQYNACLAITGAIRGTSKKSSTKN